MAIVRKPHIYVIRNAINNNNYYINEENQEERNGRFIWLISESEVTNKKIT